MPHECDVLSCLLPRSVRLACHRVFLPDFSCHCHGFAILSPSGSFGTRHLILLDPLQHLFLLKSLCSSLKVTMQTPSASFTPVPALYCICTCIMNVCLDTPCMLPAEFFHVNEVQNRDCNLHFWVSCCVSQRRVWGWKNRKHKESHPVFGSCCLLPQGQHSWQEQGRHAGMVTPNTHRH